MRVSANAIIVENGKLLLIRFDDENGPHYNLPGGGIDAGESVVQGLMRECREEASVEIIPGAFVGAWEYVPELQGNKFGPKQKLGLLFLAKLKPGSVPKLPAKPDPNQTGVEWMPIEELGKLPSSKYPPIFPQIGEQLLAAIRGESEAFFVVEI